MFRKLPGDEAQRLVTGLPVGEFIQHVSRLGIAVVRGTRDIVHEDTRTLSEWRSKSSRQTRAR